MPYILLLLVFLLGVNLWPNGAKAEELEPPDISSGAAVLMDAQSGEVIYGKEQDVKMYPASITKIVTGIVALEHSEPDELVTVSEEARYEEGTRIFLSPGEQKPMELMLYGLLLNSGNDAATAIAEHIDGSKERFSERMNELVEQLGLENTHFSNPHGLFDEDNYTTAKDMAVVTRYAMEKPVFRTIVATKTLPWDGEEWDSELVNHNKMLWRYEGATGVKNGYTSASGNTIVTTATRDGFDLIVVLLQGNSSEEIYQDAKLLLDYGFEYMKNRPPEEKKPPEPVPTEDVFVQSQPKIAESPLSADSGKPASAKWMVSVPWLLLNMFLVLVAYLKWRKYKGVE